MTDFNTYTINGKPFSIDVSGAPEYVYGDPVHLSTAETDLTYGAEWYDDGYKIMPFLSNEDFSALRAEIIRVIEEIVSSHGIDTTGFELEKYHRFVTDDATHYAIVGRTRDLYPEDFSLSMRDLVNKIEELSGFKLTDISPSTGERLRIIVRINRPHSTDYNPPHKDSYDDVAYNFLNVWVPICGVTQNSSLPIAPGSHLYSEDRILRSMEGGVVAGKKYRVCNIASWDGRTDLYRTDVKEGELLMFSCHLIHGAAYNDQNDQTRVALEFRLFTKS